MRPVLFDRVNVCYCYMILRSYTIQAGADMSKRNKARAPAASCVEGTASNKIVDDVLFYHTIYQRRAARRIKLVSVCVCK